MGGILAGITLWAVYGFEVGFWHSLPFPIPAITHLKIYQALREHYQLGHPAFLLGQNGEHGWWYYFPVAFLLKTPLPTMILLGVAGIRAVRWGEDEWRSGETICRWGPMTIYPLLYLISSLFSSVNIGYRHLLPLLPFAYIAISQVVNWKWPPLGRLVLQAMLVWLLWGTVRLFPDYLAFFNALAGGAEGGYRYLVDSNLDWGQNLWQLRDWMDEHNIPYDRAEMERWIELRQKIADGETTLKESFTQEEVIRMQETRLPLLARLTRQEHRGTLTLERLVQHSN